jgi:hypothetical protein
MRVFGATWAATGTPSTAALANLVPALLVENPVDEEMELLTDTTPSAVIAPPSRLMPETLAVAVVDDPLLVLADATDVSTAPVDSIGDKFTFATLLVFIIPAVSVQSTVAAEGPELTADDPIAAETRVPKALPEYPVTDCPQTAPEDKKAAKTTRVDQLVCSIILTSTKINEP